MKITKTEVVVWTFLILVAGYTFGRISEAIARGV